MSKYACLFVLTLCVLGGPCITACSTVEQGAKAVNRVVIIMDDSITYSKRQGEAVEKVSAMLDQMSKIKVNRWEEKSDKISIISLDASPDIIWEGSLNDLKSKGTPFWKERFDSRVDYSRCTDVSAAFRLAAKCLEGDSRYVSKYLFVFSDMLHEPPTDSISRCESPVLVSPEDFPWESLADVSVSIFWMPSNQKLLWKRAVDDHQLSSHFALYTESESASAQILDPPRPKVKLTEIDRKIQQEKALSLIGTITKWFMSFLGIITALVLGLCILIWTVRRVQRTQGPIVPEMAMQNQLIHRKQNQRTMNGPGRTIPHSK